MISLLYLRLLKCASVMVLIATVLFPVVVPEHLFGPNKSAVQTHNQIIPLLIWFKIACLNTSRHTDFSAFSLRHASHAAVITAVIMQSYDHSSVYQSWSLIVLASRNSVIS